MYHLARRPEWQERVARTEWQVMQAALEREESRGFARAYQVPDAA